MERSLLLSDLEQRLTELWEATRPPNPSFNQDYPYTIEDRGERNQLERLLELVRGLRKEQPAAVGASLQDTVRQGIRAARMGVNEEDLRLATFLSSCLRSYDNLAKGTQSGQHILPLIVPIEY
jgi:hypothetical protein